MARKYDSMYKQALDILKAMGLDPVLSGIHMYSFEYKNISMYLDKGDNHNEFYLSCPVYLLGTVEEQKDTLDIAKYMTAEDLPEFSIFYIVDGLACILWTLQVKETRHILHKKQLIHSLDRMRDGLLLLESAISLVMLTKDPDFIASIEDDNNN